MQESEFSFALKRLVQCAAGTDPGCVGNRRHLARVAYFEVARHGR
jgi:hypothetical protein